MLYPLIALFFAANWAHNDTRIDQIAWFIQHEIEEPFHFQGWETYRTQRLRRKRGAKEQRHPLALMPGLISFSARGVFLTTQFIAVSVGIIRLVQTRVLGLTVPALLVDLIAIITTYFLLSDRKAQVMRKDEIGRPHSEMNRKTHGESNAPAASADPDRTGTN